LPFGHDRHLSEVADRGLGHRTLNRVYSTPELGKDTVARSVRNAAPAFLNDPVEYSAPFSQPFDRADFVSANEAAVAFHIGEFHPEPLTDLDMTLSREDRDKASAD
jgi:hypothetical protein